MAVSDWVAILFEQKNATFQLLENLSLFNKLMNATKLTIP